MKRMLITILLPTFLILFCGCERVIVLPQDELVTSSWQCKNSNGTSCVLRFSDDRAYVTLETASGDEAVSFGGVYSVDEERLYITADNMFRTYVFAYDVYPDRAVLSYMGNSLTFLKIPTSE
ncbi:MAG: hypothetical protein IJV88_04365 [Ruminococcus sp.]|nr:hypothetical protein [Ruminococcus sp.]